MHHAAAAETVCQVKSSHAGSGAKHCTMIRRHIVQAGPALSPIYGQLFEAWHSIGGTRQYFLNECRIEVGLEPWRFVRVVPGQQQTQPFLTEMETSGHVDDHREALR